MKENLKVNILWLLLLLAGYSLISVLVSVGVLNLFYVQILQQIGINIILAVGLNLIVGFQDNFHLVMLVSWRLVPMQQLLLVLNYQPTVPSLELCL